MINATQNFLPHAPSEIFYFILPIVSTAYILLFRKDLITRPNIKAIVLRIAVYFAVVSFIHLYLSSMMQGKVIWREAFAYLYFFASVSIILFLMRSLFKMIGRSISKKLTNRRIQKLIYGSTVAILWTFVLFPYILATFTIHRPKIGDKYNPKSVLMLNYENITLSTQDGLKLKGWFIPAENSENGVVIGHGLGANKSNFLSLVNLWHSLNYNVLIFDFRGHGESDGHTISFGFKEKYDIEAAFKYLVDEKKLSPDKIVGYGVSFGGAALLHAVSAGVGFEKIITDSSFASIETMADRVIERMGFIPGLLQKSIKNIGLAFVDIELGFDIRKSAPLKIITMINKPWLIIHGKRDVLIPSQEALILFSAAKTVKKLYLIDSGGHYTTLEDAEYTNQIKDFLNNSAIPDNI